MSNTKGQLPFLYDDTTNRIIGIKNPDGSEFFFKGMTPGSSAKARRAGPDGVALPAPMLPGAAPLACCSLGNSIVAYTYSFIAQACALSGGRLIFSKNGGIGGQTSTGMISTFSAQLDANADVAFLMEGTNDASSLAMTPTQHVSNLRQLAKNCLNAGITPVIIAAPPSDVSNIWPLTEQYALAERILAKSLGIPFFDPWYRYCDTDATWVAGAAPADGVHPIAGVHSQVGADLWSGLSAGLPSPLLPRSNTGRGLFGSNALMLTDSNADGAADGWAGLSLTTPTYSLAAATYPRRGNVQSVAVSQSATGYFYRAAASGFAAGDRIKIAGHIAVPASTNMLAQLFLRAYGGSQDNYLASFATTQAAQYVEHDIVVPAGTTALQLYVQFSPITAGAFSGTVELSDFDLYNITANTF